MKSSTQNGVTTSYTYNALGQRIKKGSADLYYYDETGHLLGIYNASGSLTEETVWLGDMPIATLRPRAGAGVDIYYIHSDHLNTPREISRPSDNVIVWRWESDPFGTTAANQDPDGDSQSFLYNLRFPGQYYDSETGLHYNYFRDYDPKTGRYVQSDPIGLKGGPSTYAYVSGDPVQLVDPFGLFCTQDFLWHYYAGGGVPIDLARVGLRDDFVNHPSVRTSVDGFKNQLRIEGIQRARSGCAGRTSGDFRADFELKDQTTTNVYGVFSCLFSVASSTFFMEGGCSMVADCCNRDMTLRCQATFSIRDRFRDVCGPGCELPGGTPYLIFESFNEFMNETRSF
jgi:RHS repeat-associated protein